VEQSFTRDSKKIVAVQTKQAVEFEQLGGEVSGRLLQAQLNRF